MVSLTPTNITRLRTAGDAETQRAQGAAPAPARPAAPDAAQADTLSLSTAARSMPEVMLKGPPVDTALVERLSTAISEGNYPIDSAKIAEAMFSASLDLSS
jgi:flagellar biosynthesis anti-sigma factor FlgM